MSRMLTAFNKGFLPSLYSERRILRTLLAFMYPFFPSSELFICCFTLVIENVLEMFCDGKAFDVFKNLTEKRHLV